MAYMLEQRSNYLPAPCPQGLGCVECGGTCGMGIFDSGLDWNGWGFAEWGALIVGAYAVGSMIFTGKRGVSAVRAIPGERRKRKVSALRKKLKELEA